MMEAAQPSRGFADGHAIRRTGKGVEGLESFRYRFTGLDDDDLRCAGASDLSVNPDGSPTTTRTRATTPR